MLVSVDYASEEEESERISSFFDSVDIVEEMDMDKEERDLEENEHMDEGRQNLSGSNEKNGKNNKL